MIRDGVQAEMAGDALHQPLQRVIDLGTAEAAHEARRELVGEHDAVADADVRDRIGARHVSVHAVERGGLGRAEVGAAILELVPVQRRHPALAVEGGREGGDAVGGRDRGGEVFEPVLHPLHWPAGDPGRRRDQHRIGGDALLDAEAATAVGRGAQAQAVARHLEGARHDGVDAERPLEVGEDVVAVLVGVVFGDDAVTFHRRAAVAGIADRHGEAVGRRREGAVRIAVAEVPVAHQVGADALVQDRRPLGEGGLGVHDGRAAPVAHRHEVGPVLGAVAVRRHHDGDGLPDVADAVHRHGARVDRDAQRRHQALRDVEEVAPGDHRDDARQGQRGGRVDGEEVGVGVGRPEDRGMQRARPGAEVVDVAAAPGQEGRVLDALHGWPDNLFALDAQEPSPGRRIPTDPVDPSIVAIRASTAGAVRPLRGAVRA